MSHPFARSRLRESFVRLGLTDRYDTVPATFLNAWGGWAANPDEFPDPRLDRCVLRAYTRYLRRLAASGQRSLFRAA